MRRDRSLQFLTARQILPGALFALHSLYGSLVGQTVPPQAPKSELRAVWIATAAGLDWPKSRDVLEQQSSLRQIVKELRDAHFNTIFFQVRARGDAYYKSTFEPWAENITGTLGRNPGWDPLAFLLNEAHSAGMEVHAWFNLYKIGIATPLLRSNPPHITQRHPEWIFMYDDEVWLNPGIPQVNRYLLDLAMDLVRNYDIDGIQFDFIRYPGRDVPDQATYRLYHRGLPLYNWRRSNINAFVHAFYDSATAMKPWLKVGSTPVGNFNGVDQPAGFSDYFQDAPGWIKSGKQDYIVPQIYWDIGSTREDPDFTTLAKLWQKNSGGRHVYIGIGCYKPEVFREVAQQIDVARAIGSAGQAVFRYESISGGSPWRDRYRTLATIPAMPWKDTRPPDAPTSLIVTEDAANGYRLEWNAADSLHRQDLRWYAIYRTLRVTIDPNNPSDLIAIVPAGKPSITDSVTASTRAKYSYAVTAIDRSGNESLLSHLARVGVPTLATPRDTLR